MSINIESIKAEIESGTLKATNGRAVKVGDYTGYQVWKVCVQVLRELKIARPTPLTSQYVYNLLSRFEVDGKQPMTGRSFNEAEVGRFVRKIVALNLKYQVTGEVATEDVEIEGDEAEIDEGTEVEIVDDEDSDELDEADATE
jgi:hypothetical protein